MATRRSARLQHSLNATVSREASDNRNNTSSSNPTENNSGSSSSSPTDGSGSSFSNPAEETEPLTTSTPRTNSRRRRRRPSASPILPNPNQLLDSTLEVSGYVEDDDEHPSNSVHTAIAESTRGSNNDVEPAANNIPRPPRRRPRRGLIEKEIKQLQRTTNNLLKFTPFARLVKEIISKVSGGKNLRVREEAIQALRDATEAHLLLLFQTAYGCASHAKRLTLKKEDIQFVRKLMLAWGLNV